MTVTLLAPWALAAAGLLAIPVILHLFKPRRVRQTPFSSLRWLHLTPQKLSRRIRWHQVLLFLLRAAFLALLVLALAKPLVTAGGAGNFRERFIVLDVSHSMNYRAAGTASPIEQARALAAELVRRNRPGDRTAVLLAGNQTRLLTPLSAEPENYLPAVTGVQAGLTETDLGSALPVIRGLLARPRERSEAEVWFLTDNQQHAWRQGPPAAFLDGLPIPVKVHGIDVGVPGPQNAWITRARLLEFSRPARRVLRVELGCVGDTTQERTVRVDAAAGIPERSQAVMLAPGRPGVVDFDLPGSTNQQSGIIRFHLEPADGLPADDEFLLNLDTQGALRVLLVEGPAVASDPLPAGFHLRTALEALADAAGQPLRLTAVSAAEARPADLRETDAVFLADVPELGEEALAALEERVRSGAGLAILLGGGGKPAFLNERLYRPLQPSEGLLPAPVRPVADGVEDRLAPLTGVQWTHPLLAELDDPLVGDLAQVRFRRWHEFTAALADGSLVLARVDEGAPAIIERAFGAGRVVVLNTGAGDRWSDLPRRKSFVPFIDRLLTHLAAGGLRRNVAVGEVATVPLTGRQAGEAVAVVTPGGHRLSPPVRAAGPGRALLTFEAGEAGVYRVEPAAGSGFPVVVQVGRGDSVLAPMDPATLRRWWEPAGCAVIRGDELGRHLEAEAGRHAAWPWLLLLAGLVLLAEMYLVHRLCPRANPKLVQNIVGRRVLLRPSGSTE
jgi:hypothetical protein